MGYNLLIEIADIYTFFPAKFLHLENFIRF